MDFYEITNIKGAGTTNIQTNYVLNDENPLEGISYYRLKQVDFDGSFELSYVVDVNLKASSKFELIGISPSPASSFTYLTLNATANDNAIINIYDNKGGLLVKDVVEVKEGSNEIKLDISTFPSGIYLLSVTGNNSIVNTRVVKSENYLY